MRDVDLRALLPLYLVIFIGFCGYSLMITLQSQLTPSSWRRLRLVSRTISA
jgi:hypothetical protein